MANLNAAQGRAYVITGPTSGIGHKTALELAKHGTVVLVGRDQGKLDDVQETIEKKGQHAMSVLCDLSDPSQRAPRRHGDHRPRAPDRGPYQQCGHQRYARQQKCSRMGYDVCNGPPRSVHVDRGSHAIFAQRLERDIYLLRRRGPSAQAFYDRRVSRRSLYFCRRECAWRVGAGGSKLAGADAYATSKQCNLATFMAFARDAPRLRFNAVEPGFCPATSLGREANVLFRLLSKYVLSLLAPLHQVLEHSGASCDGHQGRRAQ